MITTPKMVGIVVAAFVAGSFVASPELRAYAAATIGSADIIDESIQSVDIKNGQVKASDIATDAVTADEIKGVTKLIFAQCMLTSDEGGANIAAGEQARIECTISGVDYDDSVSATLNNSGACVEVVRAVPYIGRVDVFIKNDCSVTSYAGAGSSIAIIVYDK